MKPQAPPSETSGTRHPSAVILFSHGSLLCGAGAPLDRHAERLRNMPGFDLVEVGYLNYSTPTFEEAVSKVTAAGATSIVVVPFFLFPGYFVSTSLPKLLAEVSPRFPGVEFIIAEPIGFDEELALAIRRSAYAARPANRWRDGLAEAASACQFREGCPIRGHEGCTAGSSSDRPFAPEPWCPMHGWQEFNERRPALLVLAHGSPAIDANAPMLEVIDRVKQTGEEFRTVQIGYLECNQPSIADAIDLCAAKSPDLIVAVPYFLHMGTHVASDLPDAMDDGRARHSEVTFEMGEFLGNMPELTDVLAKRARLV